MLDLLPGDTSGRSHPPAVPPSRQTLANQRLTLKKKSSGWHLMFVIREERKRFRFDNLADSTPPVLQLSPVLFQVCPSGSFSEEKCCISWPCLLVWVWRWRKFTCTKNQLRPNGRLNFRWLGTKCRSRVWHHGSETSSETAVGRVNMLQSVVFLPSSTSCRWSSIRPISDLYHQIFADLCELSNRLSLYVNVIYDVFHQLKKKVNI